MLLVAGGSGIKRFKANVHLLEVRMAVALLRAMVTMVYFHCELGKC